MTPRLDYTVGSEVYCYIGFHFSRDCRDIEAVVHKKAEWVGRVHYFITEGLLHHNILSLNAQGNGNWLYTTDLDQKEREKKLVKDKLNLCGGGPLS